MSFLWHVNKSLTKDWCLCFQLCTCFVEWILNICSQNIFFMKILATLPFTLLNGVLITFSSYRSTISLGACKLPCAYRAYVNPFVPNAPFRYLLKTSEKVWKGALGTDGLMLQIKIISFCPSWCTFSRRVTARWWRGLAKNQAWTYESSEKLDLNLHL